MTIAFDHTLDARGLICPEPIMMLHNSMREAKINEVIKIMATDPSTRRDIKQFCQFLNHELLALNEEGEELFFYVKKRK